jgi:DNA-binding transcriptional ArsR family regulator
MRVWGEELRSGRSIMTEHAVEKCADVFKAMGDRTRLTILKNLLRGEQCVTDLAKALEMDAPRVSFHLTRLKYAGLVTDERRGQRVVYRLNPEVVQADGEGRAHFRFGECVVTFGADGR